MSGDTAIHEQMIGDESAPGAVSSLAINPTEVQGQVEARVTLQRGVS